MKIEDLSRDQLVILLYAIDLLIDLDIHERVLVGDPWTAITDAIHLKDNEYMIRRNKEELAERELWLKNMLNKKS